MADQKGEIQPERLCCLCVMLIISMHMSNIVNFSNYSSYSYFYLITGIISFTLLSRRILAGEGQWISNVMLGKFRQEEIWFAYAITSYYIFHLIFIWVDVRVIDIRLQTLRHIVHFLFFA